MKPDDYPQVDEAWEVALRNTRRAGIEEERRRWIVGSVSVAMVIALAWLLAH